MKGKEISGETDRKRVRRRLFRTVAALFLMGSTLLLGATALDIIDLPWPGEPVRARSSNSRINLGPIFANPVHIGPDCGKAHEQQGFTYGATNEQLEAVKNLRSLCAAQSQYFSKHGAYAGGPNCFADLNWRPAGETIYTYWCGSDVIFPTKPRTAAHKCLINKAVSFHDTYTICVAGNIDRDDAVDTWSLRDNKTVNRDWNDAVQ